MNLVHVYVLCKKYSEMGRTDRQQAKYHMKVNTGDPLNYLSVANDVIGQIT